MAYASADSSLYALVKNSPPYRLAKGQVVHALDDRSKFNLIVSGYIKRYMITNEGNESIQVIYGPGNFFPLPPVLKTIFEMDIYRGPETYYYESMTDIVVHSVNLDTLEQALASDSSIYKDLLFIAGTRLNSYIHRLEDSSLSSSTWRVAHQLLFLADQFGETTDEGIRIQLPLTHQDLADILNVSRETVSRSLSNLREKKLIIAGQHIIIPNIDTLKELYS
ncbi:MAG: Crp/Fnr family transcriptional regulator [Patescibacteria group bacterium]|nr:Crp/Fnr family transcriptional regulator [Patescibacteria group bacterium]